MATNCVDKRIKICYIERMNKKIITLEMEVALIDHIGVRQNIVVTNVSWGMFGNREVDIVKLTNNLWGSEIEIKVSKQDILKDKKKKHGHESNMFKFLYFAVPEYLKDFALEHIPERAGLLTVEKYLAHEWTDDPFMKYRVSEVRKPVRNKSAVEWTHDERYKLMRLGTMRIETLKKNIVKLMKERSIIL